VGDKGKVTGIENLMLRQQTKSIIVLEKSDLHGALEADGWKRSYTLVVSEAFGSDRMVKLERKPCRTEKNEPKS
jgi:hypothetical protein